VSTGLWVILSVAGLVIAFLAGAGFGRRRANAVTELRDPAARTGPRSIRPPPGAAGDPDDVAPIEPDPDDGVVVDTAAGSRRREPASAGHDGRVIDLRRSGAAAVATDDPDGPIAGEPAAADPTAAAQTEEATPASRTSVAAPLEVSPDPVTDAPATEPEPDDEVIDLRDRVRVAIPVHNLQFVRGIGPRVDLGLRRQGITTLAALAALDRAGVERVAATIDGLSAKQLSTRRGRAREMLAAAEQASVAPPPDTTSLRLVQGIGSTMARWLETHDIIDLETLAALDREQVDLLEAQLVDFPGRIRAERWVKQASELVASG
jgi:predicted flap endonuclease-1-like 5' DNA nuclease